MKHKNQIATLALVLVMALTVSCMTEMADDKIEFQPSPAMPAQAPKGTDPDNNTPSAWAEAQVNAAITANLVPVSLQSKYAQATTRAEFCALVVSLYENVKGDITERKKFNDTNDINVEKAAAIGVVSGSSAEDALFRPDTHLTREQAAVILTRLADAVGSPLTGHGQGTDFSDKSNISDWAVGAVNQVSASGIMGSTSTAVNVFSPKNSYTREQSITTIMRLYEIVK